MTTPRTETRVDAATLVIAVGALLLLISPFLDWYGSADGEAVTAWTTFELVDVLLAALAGAALYAVVARLSPRAPAVGEAGDLARIAGPAALVLVLVSMINEPPFLQLTETSLEVGAWLALAGAALITIGAMLGRLRISVVVGDRPPPRSAPTDPAAETQTMRPEPPRPTGL